MLLLLGYPALLIIIAVAGLQDSAHLLICLGLRYECCLRRLIIDSKVVNLEQLEHRLTLVLGLSPINVDLLPF